MRLLDKLRCWLGHHKPKVLSIAPTHSGDGFWHECEACVKCERCGVDGKFYGSSTGWYVGHPEGPLADGDLRLLLSRAWSHRWHQHFHKETP